MQECCIRFNMFHKFRQARKNKPDNLVSFKPRFAEN